MANVLTGTNPDCSLLSHQLLKGSLAEKAHT